MLSLGIQQVEKSPTSRQKNQKQHHFHCLEVYNDSKLNNHNIYAEDLAQINECSMTAT